MGNLLQELDRILRGNATRLPDLREGTIKIPLGGICLVIFVLGVIYGVCMSCFTLLTRADFDLQPLIATMLKVPALFFLTLLVTFPSLYVFNALVGSRLTMAAVLRLIVAALSVTLAVLASFGPIVAFFSFTTKSYSFIILLNVVIFTVSGILGLLFLLQTLHRLVLAMSAPEMGAPGDEHAPATEQTGVAQLTALDATEGHALGPHVKAVFRIWVVVFGLVGAQMAWVLRPFIGDPDAAFTWFRPRQGNFFESVWHHLTQLFS